MMNGDAISVIQGKTAITKWTYTVFLPKKVRSLKEANHGTST